MIHKYESRRIRVVIRRVLLKVWDPIGIKDEPKAQSEYDGYIGDVYKLLIGGASDLEITERLLYIVRETMRLEKAAAADMGETVSALRNIHLPPHAD